MENRIYTNKKKIKQAKSNTSQWRIKLPGILVIYNKILKSVEVSKTKLEEIKIKK